VIFRRNRGAPKENGGRRRVSSYRPSSMTAARLNESHPSNRSKCLITTGDKNPFTYNYLALPPSHLFLRLGQSNFTLENSPKCIVYKGLKNYIYFKLIVLIVGIVSYILLKVIIDRFVKICV